MDSVLTFFMNMIENNYNLMKMYNVVLSNSVMNSVEIMHIFPLTWYSVTELLKTHITFLIND